MTSNSEVQWGTILLCVLPAIVTVATQSTGNGTVRADLRHNLSFFSPIYSASVITAAILRFISWRVVNIGGTRVCLYFVAVSYYHETGWPGASDKPHQIAWTPFFTRWMFFLGCTLPQYFRLMAFDGIPWTKLWTTCFIGHYLLQELLALNLRHSPTRMRFLAGWPTKSLMEFSYGTAPAEAAEPEPEGPISFPTLLNTCEGFERYITPLSGEKGSDRTKHINRTQMAGFWRALSNDTYCWSCGHVRCLLFKCTFIPSAQCGLAWVFSIVIWMAWLLHADFRFSTIKFASWLVGFEGVKHTWIIIIFLMYTFGPPVAVYKLLMYSLKRTWARNLEGFIQRHHFVCGLILGLILAIPTLTGIFLFTAIRHIEPTAGNVAWVFEPYLWLFAIIFGDWAACTCLGIDYKETLNASRRPVIPPDEESHPEKFSPPEKHTKISSESSISMAKDSHNEFLEQAQFFLNMFILGFPATIFWYIFCYDSTGTVYRHWTVLLPSSLEMSA